MYTNITVAKCSKLSSVYRNCEVGKAVGKAVTLRSHRMFAWPKFDTGLISLTTV